jgi:hypothetical protein
MTEPLKWCVDWSNLSFKERFLMGAPFVATEDKVRKGIIRQLNERSEEDLSVWREHPKDVCELAWKISKELKRETIWPSDLFLPDDPLDIVFAIRFDLAKEWNMTLVVQTIVEKTIGGKMYPAFWLNLESLSFLEAVTLIREMQNQTSNADQ